MCCAVLQVRYSEMPASVLSAANKLGGGRAQPALQLVGYEGEVEAAIKYAFGNTFVCQVSGMEAPLLGPWGIHLAAVGVEGLGGGAQYTEHAHVFSRRWSYPNHMNHALTKTADVLPCAQQSRLELSGKEGPREEGCGVL